MDHDSHSGKASGPVSRPLVYAGFFGLLLVAFLLRLYGYLNYPSIHHPDELFQYLEQAHRLTFGYGIIPWEYRDGTRSWLFPGLLAGLMKLSDSLGFSNPDAYLFLVASVLSALSLSVIVVGFLWAYRVQGIVAAFITAMLCSIWFELVYFAPKTLTEAVAAHLLVIAVYLAWPGRPVDNWRRLFVAGLVFGLVVSLRVHLAPALLVTAAYICRLELREKWAPLVAGGVMVVFLSGMLDSVTWQYPFQSFFENVHANIVEKRSHVYGIESWSFYIKEWWDIWGLVMAPIVLLSLLAMRRNFLLSLIPAAIILTHMLFAHKEYRFVFPATPFIVMLTGLGTAEVFDKLQTYIRHRLTAGIVLASIILLWASVSGVLAFSDAFRNNWFLNRDSLNAFAFLRDREDMCAVGLPGGADWYLTGGYTYLHRDVPIIIPINKTELMSSAYNYALASPGYLPDDGPFTSIICWEGENICIYHRDGPCERAPGMEANEVLKLLGG